MTALIEYVEERSNTIVEHISNGASTVLVDGRAGSGRTALLERTAIQLREARLRPVLVSPPERHIDTPALALIDCGVGLSEAGLVEGGLSGWSNRATWRERSDELRAWLSEATSASNGLVLLCDDVRQWAVPEAAESNQRVEVAADLILREASCVKVVVGRRGDLPADATVDIELDELSPAVLEDQARWGPLWEIVARLRAELTVIGARTPVQLGFLVAYAALVSVEELSSWWTPQIGAERLADRLAESVSVSSKLRPLWNLWLTASLPRRAVPPEWIQEARDFLPNEIQKAVADRCLLFGESELRLAREARAAAWRRDDEFARRVRKRAAEYLLDRYITEFDTARQADHAVALRHGAEALYMAARLGSTDVVERIAPNFSDQVNSIGATALEREDRSTAVTAFEIAVEWDAEDAYAHHHLGFALDADGLDPRRIEAQYVRAIELEPAHAKWHGRLVSFLIIRARNAEARARWEEAVATLPADDGDAPLDVYTKLHLPVAANLLRRAELAFAAEVLDAVPRWARPQLLGYADQRRRLEVLLRVQDDGVYVPAQRAVHEWWTYGPQLLEERTADGRVLLLWMAGRVSEVDDRGVHLDIAIVEPNLPPETGTISFDRDDFLRLAADVRRAEAIVAGQFVELGYYDEHEEAEPVVRVLPNEPWEEGLQTQLDPARFLRRRGWA